MKLNVEKTAALKNAPDARPVTNETPEARTMSANGDLSPKPGEDAPYVEPTLEPHGLFFDEGPFTDTPQEPPHRDGGHDAWDSSVNADDIPPVIAFTDDHGKPIWNDAPKTAGGVLAEIPKNRPQNDFPNAGPKCRFCGQALKKNYALCGNCGAPANPKHIFHDRSRHYQNTGNANPGLTTCRTCGKQIYRRARLCHQCGTALLKPVYGGEKDLPQTSDVKIRPKNRFKYVLLICIVIIAVIFIKIYAQH